MSDALRDEYRRQRIRYPDLGAKTCGLIARDRIKYRSLPTEWEQDGFDIKVDSDYDECCDTRDLDYLGRFAFRSSDVRHDERGRAIDRWARDYGRRNDGKIPRWYFEDAYHMLGGRESRYVIPEADYRTELAAFRSCKLGRSEADRRARELIKFQVEALESYGESWWINYVEVTASREGIVLGRAGIGGVEYGLGEDDEPIREVAEDYGLISEAIAEAEDVLRRITRRAS